MQTAESGSHMNEREKFAEWWIKLNPAPYYEGIEEAIAWHAWQAALAQQREPQKARPDFIAGYDAGMADAKRIQAAREAEKPLREPIDGFGGNLDEAFDAEPVAEVFDTFGNTKDPDKCVGHVWLRAGNIPRRGTKLYLAPTILEGWRPAVIAFANALEAKLKVNDYKGGWADCSNEYLMDRLEGEVRELNFAVDRQTAERIRAECVDVANYAMMVFDNAMLAAVKEPKS